VADADIYKPEFADLYWAQKYTPAQVRKSSLPAIQAHSTSRIPIRRQQSASANSGVTR